MYNAHELISRLRIDIERPTEDDILNLKYAYMLDITQNGIPIHFFKGDGKIYYNFQGAEYAFEIQSLAILGIVNVPYGQFKYNGDLPVMSPANLCRVPVLIPCEKNGVPDLFKAMHRSASDLCEKWYQFHFEYVETLNHVLVMIMEFPMEKLDEDTLMSFSKMLYGNTRYLESHRVSLK